MQDRTSRIVRSRPAELTTGAGAAALLIARGLGVDDPNVIVAIATVVGITPAAITWVVELVRGGGESTDVVPEAR